MPWAYMSYQEPIHGVGPSNFVSDKWALSIIGVVFMLRPLLIQMIEMEIGIDEENI